MLRPDSPHIHRGACAALAAISLASLATAQSAVRASSSDGGLFYRAYFLEHEVGDLEGALELYRAAANDGSLSSEVRAQAQRHGQGCAEELAAGDLASLMPEDTIVYLELNDPGAQVARLLEQLGLLQGAEGAGGIAISPHLLEGTLGLRGAAVGITRIDPTGGAPGGVVVLHPGDIQAVRGLIETALPAGGQPVDAIFGNATYSIEGQALVTMGERLIVASTERGLIEDVLRRVAGEQKDSLAANPDLAETMALRGQDLAFLCLNAEPVLPLVQAMLSGVAQQQPEAAMAMQLLDIESTRAIAARLGVGDDGLSMDVSLQLDEGHRNVVYNLMRMPHVGPHTFHLVPEGVAFFLASSLNERHAGGAGITDAAGRPVVTMMDVGREVFGNLVDFSVFALPSFSEGPYGQPMPDVALAMSVNDPARSKAIWELVLGVAKGAAGGSNVLPKPQTVAGVSVDRYDIEGVGVYLFVHEDRVVISPSLRAIEASVGAAKGSNVAGDPVFADLVARASSDHTSVMGVSLGRAANMARTVMPARELQEVAPFLDLLADATATATTKHSETQLAWSWSLTGLPNVGPMVEQLVRAQMNGGGFAGAVAARQRAADEEEARAMAAWAAAEAQQAHRAEVIHAHSGSVSAPEPDAGHAGLGELQGAFHQLASAGKVEAASDLVPAIAALLGDDAMALNNFAWNVISEDGGDVYAQVMLPVAERANELTGQGNWYYLDTLAHVHFALGHVEKAIETQEKAVAVAREQGDARAGEAAAALAKFQKLAGGAR